MTTVDTSTRSPGRPRSARVDESILKAVLDLLVEGHTVEALTIEAVAAKAGVGKATIYRRWPGKDALLVDAVRSLKGPAPTPVGASVRDDLVLLLGSARKKPDQRFVRIMSCLGPEVQRSPERYRLYQGLVEPRREVMREVLRRGVAAGELRPDIDIEVAVMLLTAPVLIQRMLRWHPDLDDATLPGRVVDTVLAGLATHPG
ncbi:MAG: TetR family transcriptional regulator [Micromonosporaceae bacterium]|nr:TetR family transcriptional regulator [Micromonosporaceae bacterium]